MKYVQLGFASVITSHLLGMPYAYVRLKQSKRITDEPSQQHNRLESIDHFHHHCILLRVR